mmetsp:Transcript_49738/g.154362  ORF Transcript_49738/g.154362 Transcript_49738/m.154362 type:complete len:206 (-) Transcript_49738:706-1323(-)
MAGSRPRPRRHAHAPGRHRSPWPRSLGPRCRHRERSPPCPTWPQSSARPPWRAAAPAASGGRTASRRGRACPHPQPSSTRAPCRGPRTCSWTASRARGTQTPLLGRRSPAPRRSRGRLPRRSRSHLAPARAPRPPRRQRRCPPRGPLCGPAGRHPPPRRPSRRAASRGGRRPRRRSRCPPRRCGRRNRFRTSRRGRSCSPRRADP